MTRDENRDILTDTAEPLEEQAAAGPTGAAETEDIFVSEEEVQRIMAQYDKESNTRFFSGAREKIVHGLCIAFTLYVIAFNTVLLMPQQMRRASFVGFIIIFAIMLYPACERDKKANFIPWYDWIIALAGGASFFYYVANYKEIVAQVGVYTVPNMVVAVIGILVLFECCRRVVGVPLMIVVAVFLCYAYFGKYLGGDFGHAGYTLKRLITFMFYTTEGVIGTPISVCASFIFIFILFGAFLEKTGIGQFFIDIANAVAGKAVGGPAKVAVIASALEGTVSGSSVANTVGSGSFTIPMMKKLGYKPEFAAAVEATASTGGQIMPPIMGAAAFLMAEITQIPYSRIILAAAIPATLYFTTVLLQVHFEAKKLRLKGLPEDEIPKAGKLLKEKGHLFLAIVAIVVFLSIGYTPGRSALMACAVAIVVSCFRKDTRITVKEFFNALANGTRNSVGVAVACAMAGMIVGVVTLTGLGMTFASALQSLSGGVTILALFFCMIASIVLGMGVPTTANYVIMATVTAPIVIQLGIPILAAHMFVFYFGIVADITPPVALAAYAGSAIARSDPLKTGVTATRLAIAAFLVPYIFALNPDMLFGGTAEVTVHFASIILIIISALLGATLIAAGVTGCFIATMGPLWRILACAGGLLLVIPGWKTDLMGFVVFIALLLYQGRKYGVYNPFKGENPSKVKA